APGAMSRQRPTIVDVAGRSGVSKSTVSNVIRGAANVSEETRRRVLDAVDELGYRPNAVARQLVQQRTSTIGVVVGDLTNPIYSELVKLLEQHALARGYTTMVSNTDGHPEREAARIEALLERRVAGIAMLQFSGDRSVIDELHRDGVPVTVISCDDARADCVTVDESKGLALAVRHLAELGHRSLAYVTTPLVEEHTNRARHESFLRECRRAGCSETATITLDVEALLEHRDGAMDGLRSLLGSQSRPTGFAAANDIAAIALIEAAERLGAAVPRDVSVVGFDGINLGGLTRIGLTTVAQPRERMAEVGFELLMERIEGGPDAPPRHVLLEPELVVRATTAPPR
ncbi:MAG TPA: LacI family DNA-binding transcriptional regulator, partial [Gaiellaceae bacterium]|nr:LacI family DNA-binding transcriptional regulator [Gaiellaceae bacterium]